MKWKERALVALLGVVTTLVTLELLLRVVGWGAQRLAPSGQREAGSKYTVLCVGDSFTAGYWSLPPSDAYPAQLETIFAERLGAGRVQVVNRGRSGQNTFQVLHRLDDDLGATRPDAVVVLAGGNNEWDLFSYYRYCEGDSWSASLKDQVYRLRVFKLVKLLSRDVANRLTSASRSPEMLFNLPAYSLRELRRRRQTTVEGQIAYDRGMAFWTAQGTIRAGDSATAESCFREALKHDADSVGAWLNIAWLRAVRGDAEGMVSSFLSAYQANQRKPPGRASRLANIHIMTSVQACLIRYPRLRAYAQACLEQYGRTHPDAARDMASITRVSSQATARWIRSDIVRIIQKCREQGAVVLVLNYPRYDPSFPLEWEGGLSDLVHENGAYFVDMRKVFGQLPEHTRYFADDCDHPNAAGNRVMAENVMDVLRAFVAQRPAPLGSSSAAPR